MISPVWIWIAKREHAKKRHTAKLKACLRNVFILAYLLNPELPSSVKSRDFNFFSQHFLALFITEQIQSINIPGISLHMLAVFFFIAASSSPISNLCCLYHNKKTLVNCKKWIYSFNI
jgi:hypothetical protein